VWSTVHGVWWTWWECEVSLRRTHIVKVFYTHELANAPTHDITVWNALPSSVQAATSLISFQRELKIIIGALSTTESTHWTQLIPLRLCTVLATVSRVLAVVVWLVCPSVRPSVCPSVTSRCSTETIECRITQTTSHDSPGTLVFWRRKSQQNPNEVTPNKGGKCKWGRLNAGAVATFDAKRCQLS